MPAKPRTIAAAEKRVITHEISTLKKAARKIIADDSKEQKRLLAEERKLTRLSFLSVRAKDREIKAITRRIAILEGRL